MPQMSLRDPEQRIEGRDKVTGAARYTADLRREGMLHVAILRSPLPHARIVSIDVEAARAMPGVRAVLTGEDTRPARLGRQWQDWPVLAWDRVLMVGDRVAAVAAETPEQAQAALWEIVVDYEELPPVLDPAEALTPEAPVLHPDADGYRAVRPPARDATHPNMQGRRLHEHGDVDAGLAAAAHVFEHEFELARVATAALEPRASLVWIEDGRTHVATTNKAPFRLREQMSASLGIDADDLAIETTYIGGDFGGKGLSIDEHILTFLAAATGRPVRSVSGFDDDLTATNTRHAGHVRLRTGFDADGRILAHEAWVLLDGGAYAAGKPHPQLTPPGAVHTLPGYTVPAARIEAVTAYTNSVPGGQARAPAHPQIAFAAETHLDAAAEALGIDPLELRLRNALRPGELDVAGHTWERPTVVPVLELLRDELAKAGPPAPGRGRGIGLSVWESSSGKASLVLRVTDDGDVEVATGAPEQGGGVHTMIRRVVATALGAPEARVGIRHRSTDEDPFDVGVGGSRVTPLVGGAARAGGDELARRLEELAPGLPVEEQLAAVAGTGLEVVGAFEHPGGVYGTNAYAIEVEVDPGTGQVTITDCLLLADVGTLINPLAARGQLLGGFVFGLGQALMEELRLEGGTITTANLGDYKLPTMGDVPPVRVVLYTDDPGGGPYGAKSVGELTNSAIIPAIGNAIAAACGVRLHSTPFTSEKVFDALRAAAG